MCLLQFSRDIECGLTVVSAQGLVIISWRETFSASAPHVCDRIAYSGGELENDSISRVEVLISLMLEYTDTDH
jgi:hypothetical protein